jgi:hypothetical protein
MSGRTRFCLFAFSLIAFPIVAWAQKTPGYTFHQITYPGSEETQVIAINDHTSAGGDVVGRYWYRPNDDEEILSPYFVKWGSSYLPLTFEGREGHYPTALNNPRLIVGHHPTAEGWVGFEYLGASQEHQTKEFSDIQFPGAVETWPTGVNDAGTVVGHYYAAGSYPPFILQGDTYANLRPIAGWEVWPSDINNKGQVAGTAYHPATERPRIFLLTAGRYQFFTHPLSTNFMVAGLNDHGHIVGSYWVHEWDDDLTSCCWRGFLLKNGTFTTINVTNDAQTRIAGINNAGNIAGTFWRPHDDWLSHGFRAVPKPPKVASK